MVQLGKVRVLNWSQPKRLLDHLNAADLPESVCIDRTDRFSRLFAEAQGTTDTNEKTRKSVRDVMLPSRRGKQFAGVIDGRVDHGRDPWPSRGDGELWRQVGIKLLDVEGRGACVVNRNLEFNCDCLLKESCERGDHGLE